MRPPARLREAEPTATRPLGESSGTVRSIERALNVIREMNARPVWPLQDLQRATKLPKSTLSRILRTLIELDYVRLESRAGMYALTSRVQLLGAGYTEQSRLTEVGSPLLRKLTDQIGWPLALGMLDGDAIVVRFSSMPYSPLAVHTTTLGYRLGLLDTAMGRAYLAFCPAVERDAILAHLANIGAAAGRWTNNWLPDDLTRVRNSGYAVRQPHAGRASATLAVPVVAENGAIAVIGMTTFGRSLTQFVIDRHLPLLKQLAAQIVQATLTA